MSNLMKKQEKNISKGVVQQETVKKEVDTGLIFRKILYGATKVELDINYMKELFNFQFLTEDERKLLREYIELAEKLNCNKISEKVLKLKDNYFKEIFEHDMSKVPFSKRMYVIKHYILFTYLTKAKNSLRQVKGYKNKFLYILCYLPGILKTKQKF